MGALTDIFSGIDTLKRKVGDAVAHPGLTLEQLVARYGEDNQNNINLQANAYPMAGDKTVLNSPDQIARFRAELADVGANQALAGMFIGHGAKTWDAIKAKQAEQMTASGIDPRKVWSDTGTWKGPDGAWRQEIPDNLAKSRDYQLTPAKAFQQARFNAAIEDSQPLRDRAESMLPYWGKTKNQLTDEFSTTGGAIVDTALSGDLDAAKKLQQDRFGLSSLLDEMSNSKSGPASSFLKHGDLGQAYPDVYGLHTRIDPDELAVGTKAHYFQGDTHQGEQIVLGEKPTFSGSRSSLLHEMQHAIQNQEGWARGGNTEEMGNYLAGLRDENSKLNGIVATSKGQDKWTAMQQLEANQATLKQLSSSGTSDFELYRRLAGEAEARATQARIPLTAEQRLATFPADSYDVPLDQLIVRRDGTGPQQATVWHGSPHKFNAFDASKIGTGEGAQAYGHGLYLADSQDVAGQYQRSLAKRTASFNDIKQQPASFVKGDSLENNALRVMPGYGDTPVQASSKIRKELNGWVDAPGQVATKSDMQQIANWLDENARGIGIDKGSLYKVDLPDEHIAKMANLDAPIEQQPQAVQDYYNRLGILKSGQPLSDHMAIDKWAADEMQRAGVPGIRYLDGGSRGAGQGTSNYVIFPGNESMLNILERNGQPMNQNLADTLRNGSVGSVEDLLTQPLPGYADGGSVTPAVNPWAINYDDFQKQMDPLWFQGAIDSEGNPTGPNNYWSNPNGAGPHFKLANGQSWQPSGANSGIQFVPKGTMEGYIPAGNYGEFGYDEGTPGVANPNDYWIVNGNTTPMKGTTTDGGEGEHVQVRYEKQGDQLVPVGPIQQTQWHSNDLTWMAKAAAVIGAGLYMLPAAAGGLGEAAAVGGAGGAGGAGMSAMDSAAAYDAGLAGVGSNVGGATALGSGSAAAAFNPAMDSQLANVAIDANGGNALAGYGTDAIGSNVAQVSNPSLWQQAQSAYQQAQPYVKGYNAGKSVENGNIGGAVASYLPGVDFGAGAANPYLNSALRTTVAGGNPVNGLISAGINSGINTGINAGLDVAGLGGVAAELKPYLPLAKNLVAASKGKLNLNQALSIVKSYNTAKGT